MAQTITERVYDELTHKLRQWEKLAPAPHELLGALKSWSQIGNADIEAAANAAAGLAVKSKDQRMEALDEAKMIYEDTRRIHTTLLRDGDVNSAHILDLARDMMSMFNRYKLRLVRPYTDEFIQWAKDTSRSKSSNDSAAMLDAARKVVKVLANPKNFIPQPARSVKAFANVPDVPAALAHLRTAHAAIKAQLDAERSAPPRDGGFAGVKGWTENATIEDAASQMDNLWRGWMSSFRVFTRDPEKGARRAAQHWAEVLSRNATYDRVPAAQRVYNLLDQAIDQPTEAAAVPYIGRALVELRNIVRELKAGRGFKGVGVKADAGDPQQLRGVLRQWTNAWNVELEKPRIITLNLRRGDPQKLIPSLMKAISAAIAIVSALPTTPPSTAGNQRVALSKLNMAMGKAKQGRLGAAYDAITDAGDALRGGINRIKTEAGIPDRYGG